MNDWMIWKREIEKWYYDIIYSMNCYINSYNTPS